MSKFKISKDLQDTVLTNEHIETVYFSANGQHSFHAHSVGKEKYMKVGAKSEKHPKDPLKTVRVLVPDETTKIIGSMTRDEVLNSEIIGTINTAPSSEPNAALELMNKALSGDEDAKSKLRSLLFAKK